MIARVKNAQARNHKKVDLPSSNFKTKIVGILKDEGFIKDFKINTEKNKWFDIGPHSLATRKKTKSSIFYKHLYYDFNQNIENYSAINFAKLYLDSKGVKNYHFIWTTIPLEHMEVPQWNSVDIQYINIRDSENPNYIHLDYACDDMHPGPQTQNLIDYTMYNTILND